MGQIQRQADLESQQKTLMHKNFVFVTIHKFNKVRLNRYQAQHEGQQQQD